MFFGFIWFNVCNWVEFINICYAGSMSKLALNRKSTHPTIQGKGKYVASVPKNVLEDLQMFLAALASVGGGEDRRDNKKNMLSMTSICSYAYCTT